MATRSKFAWALSVGAVGLLVGLILGAPQVVGAAPKEKPVLANQGAAGSSAWPVTASQNGVWTVGVSSLPSLPNGSNTIGNVGISSALPTGTNNIGNVGISGALPAGSNAIGSVGISGALPTGSNNIGNVGISGALPAGTNDIGTVHVAAPSSVVGALQCTAANGQRACDSSGIGQAAGTILNTLSVTCNVAAGQKPEADYVAGSVGVAIPVTFQQSFNGRDFFSGTLTNVGFPVQSTGDFLSTAGDYLASSGNGASCYLSYVGTSP